MQTVCELQTMRHDILHNAVAAFSKTVLLDAHSGVKEANVAVYVPLSFVLDSDVVRVGLCT